MVLDPKMRVRRRMAKTSFATIILGVFAMFGAIIWGDDGTAARLTAGQAVLIFLFGFLTSIVGAYMGITAHAEHTDRKKTDAN